MVATHEAYARIGLLKKALEYTMYFNVFTKNN